MAIPRHRIRLKTRQLFHCLKYILLWRDEMATSDFGHIVVGLNAGGSTTNT
jgi:hypothetical protein